MGSVEKSLKSIKNDVRKEDNLINQFNKLYHDLFDSQNYLHFSRDFKTGFFHKRFDLGKANKLYDFIFTLHKLEDNFVNSRVNSEQDLINLVNKFEHVKKKFGKMPHSTLLSMLKGISLKKHSVYLTTLNNLIKVLKSLSVLEKDLEGNMDLLLGSYKRNFNKNTKVSAHWQLRH